jgi:hypothetical protein
MTQQATDRRLTMRVLARWRALAEGRRFPRRSQLDPQLFGQDWSNCLLIDVDPRMEQSRLAFVGDDLRDPAWPHFERQRIAECLTDTLLQLATSKIPEVLARAAPVGFGGPATYNEAPILYRAILLPLSEGGQEIDGMLGAVSYREVSERDEVPADDRFAEAWRKIASRTGPAQDAAGDN